MPHPLHVRTSTPRTLLLALVALVAAVAVVSGAAPAARADTAPADTAAAHLADLLAEQPDGREVVVSELLAGEYDVAALEEELRAEFDRLDTPYHVVVTPYLAGNLGSDTFLASLQDRVGEDGLYVHMNDGHTVVRAFTTPGVDLRTGDATTALMGDESYDHTSRLQDVAAGYVDLLLDPEIAARADAARDSFGQERAEEEPSGWAEFVEELDPLSYNGPANTGFLVAMVGGGFLGLGLTAVIVRGYRLAQAQAPVRGGRRVPASRRPGAPVVAVRRRALRRSVRFLAVCAVIAVATVGAGAVHVLRPPASPDERADAADPLAAPPYVASTVRVDRVVAAWEDDPVYVDPLAPVDGASIAELSDAVAGASVPVHAAVVLMADSDEAGGDAEVLAHALAHTRDEDGLYLVADVGGGKVGIAALGVDLGVDTWDLTGLTWDPDSEDVVRGPTLTVLGRLDGARPDPDAEDTVPREAEYRADEEPPESRTDRFLSEDFWPALFFLGPLFGALVYSVLALAAWLTRRVRAVPGRRLRPIARRAAARMVAAVDAAPADHPNAADTMRDADTALLVLNGDPDELDLVGATVLARRVTRRLRSDSGQEASVCMVDPLHGPAVGEDATALSQSRLPMCASCLTTADRARLPLRVRDGRRRVPHLTLNRSWVRTRYGSQGGLDADSLVKETHAS
ncbi:hypothetical protein KIK06_11315 [Nocardiopsis sp. EMB25]|uniref:hypothetical protein n=1 Tax=Nocardiopsis sp. EMB25 TaxID=2835867 RepID=UPI0022846B27|nr:hypothetical protein [Nocardiopsis sp. EMB25]MCY9784480.1 hypothetical protein [Nocardiopsis sp. EMB25]